MFLSIIIPAFNESKRLPKTLIETLAYLNKQNYEFEIIVVDDGSTDGMGNILIKQFSNQIQLITLEYNSGKGKAVKVGVLHSQGKYVLYMDADGSTAISEIEKLQKAFSQNCQLAIGSRKDNTLITVRQPFYREYLGRTFNYLVRSLIGTNIIDTQCGFKLMEGDLARELFNMMTINGFSFDVELLYLAVKKNYSISEIPVIWVNDLESKVIVWRDPFFMFIELLKIKYIHRNLA